MLWNHTFWCYNPNKNKEEEGNLMTLKRKEKRRIDWKLFLPPDNNLNKDFVIFFLLFIIFIVILLIFESLPKGKLTF